MWAHDMTHGARTEVELERDGEEDDGGCDVPAVGRWAGQGPRLNEQVFALDRKSRWCPCMFIYVQGWKWQTDKRVGVVVCPIDIFSAKARCPLGEWW